MTDQPKPPPYAAVRSDPVLANGLVVSSYGRRILAFLLEIVLCIVTLGIGYLIWTLFAWSKGQSPGKQVMKMRVVEVDSGHSLGWGMMFVRDFLIKNILVSILSIVTFGIGWLVAHLLILRGDMHQPLWDLMLKSTVVDDPQGVGLSR